MLNYVKTLLYCDYPTLPARGVFLGVCKLTVVAFLLAGDLEYTISTVCEMQIQIGKLKKKEFYNFLLSFFNVNFRSFSCFFVYVTVF